MRISLVCRSTGAWRLPSQWTLRSRKRTFTRSFTAGLLLHNYDNGHNKTNVTKNKPHHNTWCGSLRKTTATPPCRKFSVYWLLWPELVFSTRGEALRNAAVPHRCFPLRPAVTHAVMRAHKAVERFLSVVERPARIGAAGAITTLRIAVQLGVSVLQLCQEVYLYIFSHRLRRLLRFALGVPFLVGTLFLLEMRERHFPEVGAGLDTACVQSLPLCHSVEEAMAHAALLQQRYRQFVQVRRERGKQGQVNQGSAPAGEVGADVGDTPPSQQQQSSLSPSSTHSPSLSQPLTREEENEVLGAMFVLIRSVETQFVGTAEERELITPRTNAVAAPTSSVDAFAVISQQQHLGAPLTSTAATTVELEDVVTATPHLAESPVATAATLTEMPNHSSAVAPAPAVVISPAEYILRVIMAIAIAEGWADITEHTRVLFQELVRSKTPPIQSRIAQAVGELCSLSYELESGQVDAITLDQRKRIAAAIDAFRPEKSVEERCTIAHEITILPLPDFDHTTRCLGLIRKSPGRKSQLILCFVGSNSKRNWLTNFNYWPVLLPARYGVVGAPLPGGNGLGVAQPHVHRGFLGLVQTVPYKEVAADFDHVLLVGHSLGGALAQLAGLELAAERPSRRITVITMASPRVLAVDWRSGLRMASRHAWEHRGSPQQEATHRSAAAVCITATAGAPGVPLSMPPQPGDAHERDSVAAMLVTPPNYRHFRGFLQPDVIPHLPPEFLHFTHTGQRIPLNTGCATSLSFIAWGMYSELFHSADFYRSVLKQPIVSQTHWYVGDEPEEEELIDAEEHVRLQV